MSVGWTLRPVREEDRPFLREVYGRTRTEELAVVAWTQEQKEQFLDQQFEAQDAYYREQFPDCSLSVLVVDGEDVGRLYVDRRTDEIRIVDIALLPPWRGRGVGSDVMQTLLREAGDAGLPVRIHVEETNPAQRLYQRLGFRPLQHVGTYVLLEWRPDRELTRRGPPSG